MTLAFEKFNSIKKARRILLEKFTDDDNLTNKIALTRKEVYYMLKHYPYDDWVDGLEKLYNSHIKENKK